MKIPINISLAAGQAHKNYLKLQNIEAEGYTPKRHTRKPLSKALKAGRKQENMECVKNGEKLAMKIGVYARTPGQPEDHIGSIFKKRVAV